MREFKAEAERRMLARQAKKAKQQEENDERRRQQQERAAKVRFQSDAKTPHAQSALATVVEEREAERKAEDALFSPWAEEEEESPKVIVEVVEPRLTRAEIRGLVKELLGEAMMRPAMQVSKRHGRRRVFLEVFSGRGALARAIESRGKGVIQIDTSYGFHCDMANTTGPAPKTWRGGPRYS